MMGKAKINVELDERLLAQAQAYAAENRTSLSELISAFLGQLVRKEQVLASDAMDTTLTEVVDGKVSMVDAARELGLQDTGFLLQIMREKGLTLPSIDAVDVNEIAQSSLEALKSAMRPIPLDGEK